MSQYRFSNGAEKLLTPRARGLISRMGLFLLGAAIATGCGGVASEDETTAQPTASVENASPAPESSEEPGTVSAQVACCNVKCGDTWKPPFPGVGPGDCHDKGLRVCGSNLTGVRWGTC
jgi:hypothetical protein